MRKQRLTLNIKNTQKNCGMICTWIQFLKQLHTLVKVRNKIDNEPGDCIFWVFNKYIRKLIYYFFTIIDKENASILNKSLFTAQKENTTLINILSRCTLILKITFPIVVQYQIFKTNNNAHIQAIMASLIQKFKARCWHGYTRKDVEW